MTARAQNRTAVVVHGYSTGRELPGLFARRGVRCLHVRGSSEVSPIYTATFDPGVYASTLDHEADPHGVLERLRAERPIAVVPGTESGVVLAEALAAALGLPGNPPDSSLARRDKQAMLDRVAAAGLATPCSRRGDDPSELAAWAARLGSWPVVAKPAASAGTDAVVFCSTPEEVTEAVVRIIGHRNRLGSVNCAAVVQERLYGTQFFVNTVTRDGIHHVTDIWREVKIEVPRGSMVSEAEILVGHDSALAPILIRYVSDVLDALDIRHGAAHTELMLTDAGPVLIESGARLIGAISRRAIQAGTGSDQAEALVESIVDPDGWSRRERCYRRRQHVVGVWLVNRAPGVVRSLDGVEEIRALPSFSDMLLKVGVGDPLEPTVDVYSSPGLVYLAADDEEAVRRDHDHVRRLERDGLFDRAAVIDRQAS